MSPALSELLGANAVDAFIHTHWPNRHLVVHGTPERFTSLAAEPICVAPQNAFLAARARKVNFLAVDGETVLSDAPSPEQALKLYDAGFTIFMGELPFVTEAGARFRLGLARELAVPPERLVINGFASRRGVGRRDRAPHFDSQENFIVQLRGTKVWHVARNRSVEYPTMNHAMGAVASVDLRTQQTSPMPERMPDDSEAIVLQPGSVLFLPRGYWHDTETLSDSFHLVLSAAVPTWFEIALQLLVTDARVHELAWRTPAFSAPRDGRLVGPSIGPALEQLRCFVAGLDRP